MNQFDDLLKPSFGHIYLSNLYEEREMIEDFWDVSDQLPLQKEKDSIQARFWQQLQGWADDAAYFFNCLEKKLRKKYEIARKKRL